MLSIGFYSPGLFQPYAFPVFRQGRKYLAVGTRESLHLVDQVTVYRREEERSIFRDNRTSFFDYDSWSSVPAIPCGFHCTVSEMETQVFGALAKMVHLQVVLAAAVNATKVFHSIVFLVPFASILREYKPNALGIGRCRNHYSGCALCELFKKNQPTILFPPK